MSQPIPSIRVDLNDEQMFKVRSIMEKARAADEAGEPGMVLAQVFGGEMRVFFLDGERGREFQRIMGVEVGRTNKPAIVQ